VDQQRSDQQGGQRHRGQHAPLDQADLLPDQDELLHVLHENHL
jgi:hypothetical protein